MTTRWTHVPCERCNATGDNPHDPGADCGLCMGRGYLDVPPPDRNEQEFPLSLPIAPPPVADEPPAPADVVWDMTTERAQ